MNYKIYTHTFFILFLLNNLSYSQCVLQEIYYNKKLSKQIYFTKEDKPLYVKDLLNNITEIYNYKDTLLLTKFIYINSDTFKYYYFYNENNKIEKIRTLHNSDIFSVTFYNYHDTLPFEVEEYTDSLRYLTRYVYDNMGRVKELSYIELSDTATTFSQNWIYNYDNKGNLIKKIQLKDNDTLSLWLYEYSDDNLLLKEIIQNDLTTLDVLEKYYIYNKDGNLKELLYVRNNLIVLKEKYKTQNNTDKLKGTLIIDYTMKPPKKDVWKYKLKKVDCNVID